MPCTTESQADAEGRSVALMGADLRALRRNRGLTLIELAGDIGRSVGHLSQVERGISRPSIDDLRALASRLGVPLAWFMKHDGVSEGERGCVVRAGFRRRVGTVQTGLVEELLSPDLGASFAVFRSIFAPGARLAAPLHRKTEEAGYVVSGSFEIRIGERSFRLEAGDSFRISDEPFQWRNPGDAETVVIWVIAPPIY